MPYASKIRTANTNAPRNLGSKLGQWAILVDLPVFHVSKATGASRQTVYNWFSGGEVAPAYRERVQALVEILALATDAEDAWRKACQQFNLEA
jgi:hypothetical protein